MALSEATWLGRTDKEITFKTVQKYMKVDDPRILESIHKNYLLGTIPARPYPIEAAVETAIKEVGLTQLARQRKEADGVPRRKHLKGDRERRFLYPLAALKRGLWVSPARKLVVRSWQKPEVSDTGKKILA